MDERRELLARIHSGQEDESSSRKDMPLDTISEEFERDPLFADKLFETRGIFAGFALSDADGRKWSAICVADVEDIAEADDPGLLLGIALVGRFDLAYEWGEDHEALLAFLDEAAKRAPVRWRRPQV
jgi:hypothetical protein